MRKLYSCLAVILLILPQLAEASPSNVYYTAENGIIYQINQTSGESVPINLHGVSWFGFETTDHVVYGLNYRNWHKILLDIKNWDLMLYSLNPDLRNLTSLEIMEKIIVEAEKLHIYILLDYHSIGCRGIESLWYTEKYPEKRYIADWLFMAKKFGEYPNVIGGGYKERAS